MVISPLVTVAAVAVLCATFLLARAVAIVYRSPADEVQPSLPTFSVIVPLEPGNVAQLERCMEALERLRYPADRLGGSLLIARDDRDTVDRVSGVERPEWLRVAMIDVPPGAKLGQIWTRGLSRARGELSLVVDPSDPPRSDDLLVAARALAEPSTGVIALNGTIARYRDLSVAISDGGGPTRTRGLGFNTRQGRRVLTSTRRARAMRARGEARPRVCICVPTYNESELVEPFIAAVLEEVERMPVDARLVVIDDNSPDGTGSKVAAIAALDPRVELLSRPAKEGIGPAYLAGFRQALDSGAELVVQMDCDFSHDPSALHSLIAATKSAHVVIGSRYVPGGLVDAEWSRFRRSLSRWGNVYARRVLSAPVNDLTGGFKCFRREALELMDLDAVATRGYGFQIETTYRALSAGLRVVEVPIEFRERLAGESKMSSAIAFEAAIETVRLRGRVAPAPLETKAFVPLPQPGAREGLSGAVVAAR